MSKEEPGSGQAVQTGRGKADSPPGQEPLMSDDPKGFGPAAAVLGPFAAGYFLSYLLRNVNAVIAPELAGAFGLDASDLGLLTSAYFFTFALFQPLLGVLLDRFGPRRVEGVLLLVAAGGCLFFAFGGSLLTLLFGRCLIGLGVSACLMAAFQANALWFGRPKLAAMNGWVLAGGGLGAVFSTAPVELALQWTDWRGLFLIFAAAFCLVSLFVFFVVPEKGGSHCGLNVAEQLKGLALIARSREFWRIAPLSFCSQSTYMALQGLWAASWMRDVALYSRQEIAQYLLLAAVAMALGHLVMGNLATRLGGTGRAPNLVVAAGVAVAIVVQAALAIGCTSAGPLIWFLFGFLGTAGTVNFAILAQAFPVAMAGRAITTLNLLIFVATFGVQWGMGAVVNRFPASAGHYAAEGYALAFGAAAVAQAGALLWFLRRLPEPAGPQKG